MRPHFNILFIVLMATNVAVQSLGQVESRSGDSNNPSNRDPFNPQPSAGDFELPMPGGGKMVFRKVPVGPSESRRYTAGNWANPAKDKEKLAEVSVAGPFREGGLRFFYIGKYEVTCRQFEIFVPDATQASTNANKELPQTRVTQLDVDKFLREYNLFLENDRNKGCLPKTAADSSSKVALPDEAEWEFAARGGILPIEVFQKKWPYDGNLNLYEWFAGERSSSNKLQPIGKRRPNPLGIHDMLGNASELTRSPFNRSGIAEGPATISKTIRGASVMESEEALSTSLRTEAKEGDDVRNLCGFRLVIISPQSRTFEAQQESQADPDAESLVKEDRRSKRKELPFEIIELNATILERLKVIQTNKASQESARQAESLFSDGLYFLSKGKITDSTKVFKQARPMFVQDQFYVYVSDLVLQFSTSLNDLASARQDYDNARRFLDQKTRSARNSASVRSVLDGSVNIGRAEAILREGKESLAVAEGRLEVAISRAESVKAKVEEVGQGLSRSGVYDAAYALLTCASMISTTSRVSTSLATSGKVSLADMPGRISQANNLYLRSLQESSARRLYAARKLYSDGLLQMPGHRLLLKLRDEIEKDILLVERAAKLIVEFNDKGVDLDQLKACAVSTAKLCSDSTQLLDFLSDRPPNQNAGRSTGLK
jgi:formylglycine-generating enzyme required for sulfatase activity